MDLGLFFLFFLATGLVAGFFGLGIFCLVVRRVTDDAIYSGGGNGVDIGKGSNSYYASLHVMWKQTMQNTNFAMI